MRHYLPLDDVRFEETFGALSKPAAKAEPVEDLAASLESSLRVPLRSSG